MREMADRPITCCYWVEPGHLLAGEFPAPLSDAEARPRLRALIQAGIRTFIDLTEAHELREYRSLAQEESDALHRGVPVRHRRMSIPDGGVPSREHLAQIIDAIDESIAEGSPVYVHCWGGIGRTGTIVACWLVNRGVPAGDALAQIARWRAHTPDACRRSPETDEQVRLVLEFGRASVHAKDGAGADRK
jgi:protein-tyrosine phosphatase